MILFKYVDKSQVNAHTQAYHGYCYSNPTKYLSGQRMHLVLPTSAHSVYRWWSCLVTTRVRSSQFSASSNSRICSQPERAPTGWVNRMYRQWVERKTCQTRKNRHLAIGKDLSWPGLPTQLIQIDYSKMYETPHPSTTQSKYLKKPWA